nr:hypothetical protein BaRGS_001873 [Batillaria attramentaria]
MLVVTSLLFVVCYIPKFIFGFVCAFVPELSIGYRLHNTFQLAISVAEILGCTNASVNFFIYFRMGSRYREAFWSMFRVKGIQYGAVAVKSTGSPFTHTWSGTPPGNGSLGQIPLLKIYINKI